MADSKIIIDTYNHDHTQNLGGVRITSVVSFDCWGDDGNVIEYLEQYVDTWENIWDRIRDRLILEVIRNENQVLIL